MKYTYQENSESCSFASPEGSDVGHATSLPGLRRALERWQDSHERVGSDEKDASLLVWKKAHHDDVTDMYPDFILRPGPRGGVIFETC